MSRESAEVGFEGCLLATTEGDVHPLALENLLESLRGLRDRMLGEEGSNIGFGVG